MPYTGGALIDISQNSEFFFKKKNCLIVFYLKDAKFATVDIRKIVFWG